MVDLLRCIAETLLAVPVRWMIKRSLKVGALSICKLIGIALHIVLFITLQKELGKGIGVMSASTCSYALVWYVARHTTITHGVFCRFWTSCGIAVACFYCNTPYYFAMIVAILPSTLLWWGKRAKSKTDAAAPRRKARNNASASQDQVDDNMGFAEQTEEVPMTSKTSAGADATMVQLALQTMRQSSRTRIPAGSMQVGDLSSAFNFIPELFLATILSYYGNRLPSLLQKEWIPTAVLWEDFQKEYDVVCPDDATDDIRNALEQELCTRYLLRFGRIVVDNSDIVLPTDAECKHAIEASGRWIGEASGRGNNCLIHSILELLVHEVKLLPEEVLRSPLRVRKECSACRAALNDLPRQDPRRPVVRDPETNEINWGELEERHAAAYLEFEGHARFIVTFFLERHGVELPSGGFELVEHSRLDTSRAGQVVIAFENQRHGSDDHQPIRLELYNNTGTSLCGYHYEPIFRARTPPPPAPAFERPRKMRRKARGITERVEQGGNASGNPSGPPGDLNDEKDGGSDGPTVLPSDTFYRMSVLPEAEQENGGDLRSHMDRALAHIAEYLRDDVTVPADPADAERADPAALAEDYAVQLPRKHCAFADCTWTGDTDAELTCHLRSTKQHLDVLFPAVRVLPPGLGKREYYLPMKKSRKGCDATGRQAQQYTILVQENDHTWLVDNSKLESELSAVGYRSRMQLGGETVSGSCCATWGTRVQGIDTGKGWLRVPEDIYYMSAYMEALSIKCREGAPLAKYAIDRRSLFNYTESLKDEDVYSLVCISCARRFPYVDSFGEKNQIKWSLACPRVRKEQKLSFLGLEHEHAKDFYGLNKYLERYGSFPFVRRKYNSIT